MAMFWIGWIKSATRNFKEDQTAERAFTPLH
jgi:hypothetical protein